MFTVPSLAHLSATGNGQLPSSLAGKVVYMQTEPQERQGRLSRSVTCINSALSLILNSSSTTFLCDFSQVTQPLHTCRHLPLKELNEFLRRGLNEDNSYIVLAQRSYHQILTVVHYHIVKGQNGTSQWWDNERKSKGGQKIQDVGLTLQQILR